VSGSGKERIKTKKKKESKEKVATPSKTLLKVSQMIQKQKKRRNLKILFLKQIFQKKIRSQLKEILHFVLKILFLNIDLLTLILKMNANLALKMLPNISKIKELLFLKIL
jgi:hypothetical protein